MGWTRQANAVKTAGSGGESRIPSREARPGVQSRRGRAPEATRPAQDARAEGADLDLRLPALRPLALGATEITPSGARRKTRPAP